MYRQQIETYFSQHRADIIRDIIRLTQIPSFRSETLENKPYGAGPAAALAEMQRLAQEAGFATRDYAHRIGTADFSDAPRALDILVHLDVVPADGAWTVCDPFAPCEKDGKLYGRGTSDDKGPAVIALYAMCAVREIGVPLKKGVRLVFGTDEECGSSDLPYYYAQESEAEMTFSPDADFPLVNCEKGRMTGSITAQYTVNEKFAHIVSLEAGGASNAVPATAHAIIRNAHLETLVETSQWHETRDGVSFDITPLNKRRTSILCTGVSAHAATPQQGSNALTALLDLLQHIGLAFCPSTAAAQSLSRLFPHRDYKGAALGFALRDEISGALTMSLDTLSMDMTHFTAGFDCRTPLCATVHNLPDALSVLCKQHGLQLCEVCSTPPHHVDADSQFVRTLLSAYEQYTGDTRGCTSMGGGTYVHDLKNGVAFGCTMPGRDTHMHGVDEFIIIDELLRAGMIYAQAIIDLCT